MAWVYVEQIRFLLVVVLFLLFVPVGLVDALAEPLVGFETEEEPSVGQVLGLAAGTMLHIATAALGEVFYAGIAMAAVTESMEGKPRSSIGRLPGTLPCRSPHRGRPDRARFGWRSGSCCWSCPA